MFRRVDGHFRFGVVFEKKLSVNYTNEKNTLNLLNYMLCS